MVNEKLSLHQLKGFEVLDKIGQNFVRRLSKFFYGLKQGANNYYAELASFLINLGFERRKKDYCVFFKIGHTKHYVLIWVEELVTAGSEGSQIEALKVAFGRNF